MHDPNKISEYRSPYVGDWFLAYSKPRNEESASFQMERQGFEVYLPYYAKLVRTTDGMVMKRSVMFPRYVFFRPRHREQSISPVRSTRGISHIVRFGNEPATVDVDLVEAVRAFEAELELISLADGAGLRAGRRVAVCSGPLKGLEGLVSAKAGRRVTVLLDVLGRQTRVSLPEHQLEPLAI